MRAVGEIERKEPVLSTLTKILIVLLTISSLFLCGVVVAYVANADNYKEMYENEKRTKQIAESKKKNADKQLKEKKSKYQRQEDQLRKQMASLNTRINKAENEIRNYKRENAELLQRVSSMAGTVESSTQTATNQTHLFEGAQKELNLVKNGQIKLRKKLDDLIAELINKTAIIKTLEIKTKQLVEEKSGLQNRLDQFLLPIGEATAPVEPVTVERFAVRLAKSTARDIDLKGLITMVDLKNKMAAISIGTADGVKEGMKFHVTRGSEFICDIIILEAKAEEAVGFLELIQYQPKVDDNVSTNL